MEESNSAIVSGRDNFFTTRKWQKKQCPFCLEEFYTKWNLKHCGSHHCADGYPFLAIPAPKAYLELDMCAKKFRTFFSDRGYCLIPPIKIVRKEERTLFASAAGQIYDDLIYCRSPQDKPQYCAMLQPVIRLQASGSIASLDGISTSFVHAATECWNVMPEEHFSVLDQWLDFFSSLGLHVGCLCFKIECADNDWAGRTVTSEMIKINYAGLEVGIANFFFNIPQPSDSFATLSDIGVGLERLVWAVNKSSTYFDGIGPLSYVRLHKRVALDAIRTATLMAASGVVPSHVNQGSKLRAMIGLFAGEVQQLNLYELVRYYYRQWASFGNLPKSQEQTYAVIWREINRSLNLETNHALRIDESLEQDHEEFLRGAVRKRMVPFTKLHDIHGEKPMNAKTTHIFLAGGGNAEESRLLDERFTRLLDLSKPLVYIPNAMCSTPYQACLAWFRSVMNPLGVTTIEMWDNLRPSYPIDGIAGIYIGGGDTIKLLNEIRKTGFDDYLYDAAQKGLPLYGGSAGAIIFGEDIRTAPEARHLKDSDSEGLRIIKSYSIFCHYQVTDRKDLVQLSQNSHQNIIAIPERAGGYVADKILINYGTDPLTIIRGNRLETIDPNCSTNLGR